MFQNQSVIHLFKYCQEHFQVLKHACPYWEIVRTLLCAFFISGCCHPSKLFWMQLRRQHVPESIAKGNLATSTPSRKVIQQLVCELFLVSKCERKTRKHLMYGSKSNVISLAVLWLEFFFFFGQDLAAWELRQCPRRKVACI